MEDVSRLLGQKTDKVQHQQVAHVETDRNYCNDRFAEVRHFMDLVDADHVSCSGRELD